MNRAKAIIKGFFELLDEIIKGLTLLIIEINKLLPQLENLIIKIISCYGWIALLLYIIFNS